MIKIKTILRLATLLVVVCSLVACSSMGKRKKLYVENSQMLPLIRVPAGAAAPKQQPLYTIPMVPNMHSQATVTLIPPGSKILQYRHNLELKKHPQQALAKQPAHWAKSANGSPVLAMKVSKNIAWAKIGRALRSTHYQILDQDNVLGSYYVLDTASTGNNITSKTPIYRVRVINHGQGSQVELLNERDNPAKVVVAKQILGAIAQHIY